MAAIVLCGVFVASCVRIGERPWPWMLAGALACVLARLAFGAQRFAYAAWVCSLFPRAVKRGADACAVGGDAYAAALNGEVRVFCFPTVACCVVGEERGACLRLPVPWFSGVSLVCGAYFWQLLSCCWASAWNRVGGVFRVRVFCFLMAVWRFSGGCEVACEWREEAGQV